MTIKSKKDICPIFIDKNTWVYMRKKKMELVREIFMYGGYIRTETIKIPYKKLGLVFEGKK